MGFSYGLCVGAGTPNVLILHSNINPVNLVTPWLRITGLEDVSRGIMNVGGIK